MFLFGLILAILLFVLWSQVHHNSLQFRVLENRFNLLEKKMADFTRTVQDLSRRPKPIVEPALAEPSPPPKAQVVAQPAAAPLRKEVDVLKSPITAKPGIQTPIDASPTATPRVEPEPVLPPSLPQPALQPRGSRTPAWKLPNFDWESLVGVKLFSWIAGVALLLAVVFFLRYSVNQGWLIPKVRMAIGILAGIALLAVCELKAARRYPVTANAMDASAIAILFSTFYAARVRWDLIGTAPAFLFMVLVTAVAVTLSIRRDSAFIALLGLLGGFATPTLLSTGENSPVSLFTYLLLLNAGLAWVAAQKKWPILTTLSLAFTVFYQWGWAVKFLTESQLPVALGIFLVFPVLAFAATSLGQKEQRGQSWISLYGQTSNITALLPLLFTLYLAAVPAYGQHYALLFGFLLLLDVGLFAIAVARGPEVLHLVGGLSTLLVPAIWMWKSYSSDAWPAISVFLVLLTFFYLFAPLIAQRLNRSFVGQGRWAVYTAPLLLFAFPALISLEPACASPGVIFAVLFVLMLGIAGYAVFAETGALYFIASLFALSAETTWAYKHLVPERLFSALVLFGILGLLYIAVPLLARRWNNALRPEGFGSGLLLISIALLTFFAVGPVASSSIWGLALLLLLLNAGLLWQGAGFKLPLIAIAGMALSWIILGMSWWTIPLDRVLIPALVVITGFALFVLAGNIWLQKHSAVDDLEKNGIFLGLAGHLFLAIIADQQALTVPPWPFLSVVLILDLAIGFSALYLRRHDLHRAAMTASALLLMIWVGNVVTSPWPAVAIISAGVLCALSFAWIYLAGRAGNDRSPFSVTALVTVILAQFAAIIAAGQPGAPRVGFLLAAHMVFLVALLGLAWFNDKHEYAVIAVFPVAIAVSFWLDQHPGPEFWRQQLFFAIPVYLVFIAYPLLLGHRSRRAIEPYLAAVLASVPFFFQARHAMQQAGLENVIGILPLSQALLMGLLLLQLLKMEPRGARALGRLALVAGAVLAFVTVAIPLQLEKEWITIGWALEAAALSWLYGKIPHKGLLFTATGLFTAVFVRLALNPSVLIYAERSEIRIWNWYLYTYLVSAAALFLGGWLLSKTQDTLVEDSFRVSKVLPAGGIILLFLLLNIEIADFYSTGSRIIFKFSATLAQDLTYTLGWALFAVALLSAGIMLRNQPARIGSLALLVATSVKCFIHDLARLGELYRVMSFVGLGVCLALVALALQKFVFATRKQS
jgi:uncharacterized membrane protein